MIAKGYARKADNSGKSGKTWYIPHHGVVHPAKPGKVCVVFDCSVKYCVTLLNNQLISGPDLTNQLVGVLTRFREEHVAFIADVEAMFHQVRVPKGQRSLLRFLWWDTSPTSSPSCSNYVLKQNSVDNKKNLGLMQQEHSDEIFMLMTC